MAKVNIKSDKITPFGEIYYARLFFEAFESQSSMGKGAVCPNLNVFVC